MIFNVSMFAKYHIKILMELIYPIKTIKKSSKQNPALPFEFHYKS